MPTDVANSVVVITGASTGIGRASALSFARSGASVVVTSRREHVVKALARQCEDLGGRALGMAADVTDEQALHSLARRVLETFGRIDVWVNNAAVTLFARFERAPAQAFRQVIETNFFGYVHGARAVLPIFREQGSGTLINISSGVGKLGGPFISAYAASKAAIIGFSDSLRMELRDAPQIHVCAVLPASIDTPIFQHGANFMGWAAKPLRPIYDAGEVAAAVVNLVRHPRRQVVVGVSARAALIMHGIAPALTERVFAREVEKRHFQDRAVPPSEGNLFKPMHGFNQVSGGWRSTPRSERSFSNVLLGAAALGAGLLILRSLGRR